MIKICLYCGNEFILETRHQLYCIGSKKDAYRKKYREYSRKNLAEYLEWKKTWNKKYNARADVKEKKRQWVIDNPSKHKEWRDKNPEKVKSSAHKSDAKRLGYTEQFSYELKKQVKERDSFTCVICGENKKALIVHHKDKTKLNNDINNLITVCRSCHRKIHPPTPKGG